ncbi:MAG TPA: hypothetical protein VH590_21455 [Ktedonobacterales bacterium]
MFGIVLKNLPAGDGFQDLIQRDLFFIHLLLGMLSHANILLCRLLLYPDEWIVHR